MGKDIHERTRKDGRTVLMMVGILFFVSFLITKCDVMTGRKPLPMGGYDWLSQETPSFRYGYDIGIGAYENGTEKLWACSDLKGDAFNGCEAGYESASSD